MSKKSKHPAYDTSYRQLFSHPEVVRDLLLGFVPDELLKNIDYSTLKPANSEYVSDKKKKRSDDVVWKVKIADDWLYLYIILEFQSQVDPNMAVRMMTYIGLLYQDLIKRKQIQPGNSLPPILPIVLYNGEGNWCAKTNVADLITPVSGIVSKYLPQVRYLVIVENIYNKESLAKMHNLMATVIRAEYPTDSDDFLAAIDDLPELVGDNLELKRTFYNWLDEVLYLNEHYPNIRAALEKLGESKMALAERVELWKQQYIQEGKLEGKQEGKQEILQRLLTLRFGALSKENLSRIAHASNSQLEQWVDKVLLADSLDNFFAD